MKKEEYLPLILIILDGWGIDKEKKGNPIALAPTPNMDSYYKDFSWTEIFAHGKHVGLPKNQVGNSEAGHMNIGAGRLVEHYNRPSIAMQDRGDELVASCRSLNGFDITGFLRSEVGKLFSAFGGHKLAGGFSLPKENLEKFLNHINKAAKEKIDISHFVNILNIECEIKPNEFNIETKNYLNKFEPFGLGNPEPTLIIRNAKLLGIKAVGKEKDHLQFPVQIGNNSINAIAFRLGKYIDEIDIEKPHDIAFNLDINEWNGRRKLQMRVIDIKKSIIY